MFVIDEPRHPVGHVEPTQITAPKSLALDYKLEEWSLVSGGVLVDPLPYEIRPLAVSRRWTRGQPTGYRQALGFECWRIN